MIRAPCPNKKIRKLFPASSGHKLNEIVTQRDTITIIKQFKRQRYEIFYYNLSL